ncbi:MAG: hypothetical protein IT204_18175 [Fimbriimonadaceae bacterium]|nr:hypothetical protein [Fimbriimonadaceae bacterium]
MPRFGPLIAEFSRGSRVEHVPVLVVEATASMTKDQKPYGRYVFRDRSGTVPGIRWEHQVGSDEAGAIAYLSGAVEEFRGSVQVKVAELTLLPAPSELVYERLRAAVDASRLAGLVELLQEAKATLPAVFWRCFELTVGHDPFDLEGPFWTFAAAQSKHHAEHGGLAWHVLTMYQLAGAVAAPYPKLDVALLKLAVLTHDLGKLDCYEMGAAGARQLSLDRSVGHTSYGMARVLAAIAAIRASGAEFSVADEENLLHCIASHHGRLDWGAVREPATPEAAALHAIDLLDSQLRGGTDPRPEGPPDRGPAATAAAAPAPAAPPGAEPDPFDDAPPADDDPFSCDDDDPFAEGSAPQQPSLF